MFAIDRGLEGCNQIVCYDGSDGPKSGLSKVTICDTKMVYTHVLLENVHHTIPYLQLLKPYLDIFRQATAMPLHLQLPHNTLNPIGGYTACKLIHHRVSFIATRGPWPLLKSPTCTWTQTPLRAAIPPGVRMPMLCRCFLSSFSNRSNHAGYHISYRLAYKNCTA